MKHQLKSALLGLGMITVLTSTAVQAADVPANRTITKVYTYSTLAVIKYAPSFSNGLGCSNASANSFAAIELTTSSAKFMYAAALAAQATGADVGLGFSGCSTAWGGIPKVTRVETVQ